MTSDKGQADVVCPVCSQAYAVYFSRPCDPECGPALEAVRVTLISHHERDRSPLAHPSNLFNVPAWNGPADMSGAALLSGAPVRRSAEMRGGGERLVS